MAKKRQSLHEKDLRKYFNKGIKGRLLSIGAPEDSEVDKWLKDAIETIKIKSVLKLNMDGENFIRKEPITIIGFNLFPTGGVEDKDLVWKEGKDGILRFGVYTLMVLHFTDSRLGAYLCDYYFIKDAVLNEITKEYLYQDIVGVYTIEESLSEKPKRGFFSKLIRGKLLSGEELISIRTFGLSFTSGEHIDVPIDMEFRESISGKMPSTDADGAVNAIRERIRDKKGLPVQLQSPQHGEETVPVFPESTANFAETKIPDSLDFLRSKVSKSLDAKCPACRNPIMAEWKFCPNCQSPLQQEDN